MPVVEDLPITRLLPNVLTILALCSGLTAMQFALHEQWGLATLSIVIAAIFDVLDGRVARMLNIASKFGAELDSLSDCVSFGVAPAFVLYLWTMQEGGDLGWVALLVLPVCTALRLARFNTMLEQVVPTWAKSYFTGVPAPAGAGLALFPLFIYLSFGEQAMVAPQLVAVWVILSGAMMVSRVPTMSLKGRRIAPAYVAPAMMLAGLLIALLITRPWLTMTGIIVIYILFIPYGWIVYRNRMKKEAK